jgi:ribonuclease D
MDVTNIKNGNIEIVFVDTNEKLLLLCQSLQQKSEFAFDTEFDRFWREYGFKLFLLQIFDGEKCYLVDPLAFKNLQPLWTIFEDVHICKVAYACTEDIQILKINHCNPVNVFDLQVAAKLCNHPANSFGDLVAASFNIAVDKSLQRSNWRTRPLNNAQQIYASNDVIFLLKLKNNFLTQAIENNVLDMLQEENKCCEEVPVTEYVVKLNSKQKATLSNYKQLVLLNLFHIRNEVAAAYNMPPANIVTDNTLENIIENKKIFIAQPFKNGFCSRLLDDETNKEKFLTAIESIDETIHISTERKARIPNNRRQFREDAKENVDINCKKINETVAEKYGTIAAEYILRGLKKAILIQPYNEIKLRNYQHKVIDETCLELNIIL